jgi:hypothetical protein
LQQLIMSFVLIDWPIRSSPLRCLVGSSCSIFSFVLWKGSFVNHCFSACLFSFWPLRSVLKATCSYHLSYAPSGCHFPL